MNGRALNEKAIEVSPSSTRILDHAAEVSTPFPPRRIDLDQVTGTALPAASQTFSAAPLASAALFQLQVRGAIHMVAMVEATDMGLLL